MYSIFDWLTKAAVVILSSVIISLYFLWWKQIAIADLEHWDEEWRLDKHFVAEATDVFVPNNHPNPMQISQQETQDGVETLSAQFNMF